VKERATETYTDKSLRIRPNRGRAPRACKPPRAAAPLTHESLFFFSTPLLTSITPPLFFPFFFSCCFCFVFLFCSFLCVLFSLSLFFPSFIFLYFSPPPYSPLSLPPFLSPAGHPLFASAPTDPYAASTDHETPGVPRRGELHLANPLWRDTRRCEDKQVRLQPGRIWQCDPTRHATARLQGHPAGRPLLFVPSCKAFRQPVTAKKHPPAHSSRTPQKQSSHSSTKSAS